MRKKLRSFEHGLAIKTHPKIGFNLICPAEEKRSIFDKTIEKRLNQTNQESALNKEITTAHQVEVSLAATVFKNKSRNYYLLLYLLFFAVFIYWIVTPSSSSSPNKSVNAVLDERRNVILPFSYGEGITAKYQDIEEKFAKNHRQSP